MYVLDCRFRKLESILAYSISSNQWLGIGEGSNQFHTVLLDLDEHKDYCSGSFFAFENNENLPSIFGKILTDGKNAIQNLNVEIFPLHPNEARIVSEDEFSKIWPNADMSTHADLELVFSENNLKIKWKTALGQAGACELFSFSNPSNSKVDLIAKKVTWEEFKQYTEKFSYKDFIFRGQSNPWPIITSFHRTHRKDLVSYINNDLPQMYRTLYPYINPPLDPGNRDHNTAMFHLLQHYGYPTPMLDWTYSAYIAAYFAFSSLSKNTSLDDEFVRIFVFDLKNWQNLMPSKQSLTFTTPHITFLNPLPIANDRSVPQQGLSMATNCFGIENFVQFFEKENNTTFLAAMDISKSERQTALKDLRKMGITAASMFPGIDGACQNMKGMNFGD